MVGQVVGYVRVSSVDQNPDRQLEAIGECTKVFTDKVSGKSRAKRTGLAKLLDYIRDGDTVRVASMDRLGRSTRDLFDLVDEIAAKGAAVEFVKERITVDKHGSSPIDALMLGVMASFAEFERNLIRERQAEGIALAKAKGKYVQVPKLSAQDVEQAQAMIDLGLPKTEIAVRLGVSRQTLYSTLHRYANAEEHPA
ncbi:transposase [Citricoccus zhacaiensis]|uniref:Transposase n=1 Tax=Citricoccus zhacaiensis TaxID=489142 RepID=A0ABQ2MA54_9MICC|nr:recombinase family protein [Citricoccus zhacaiensis]GGO48705.1 transposase [Citricoccus zhacaiensis]